MVFLVTEELKLEVSIHGLLLQNESQLGLGIGFGLYIYLRNKEEKGKKN